MRVRVVYLSEEVLEFGARVLVSSNALEERDETAFHSAGIAANNHAEALERGVLLVGLDDLGKRFKERVCESDEMGGELFGGAEADASKSHSSILGDRWRDLGRLDNDQETLVKLLDVGLHARAWASLAWFTLDHSRCVPC